MSSVGTAEQLSLPRSSTDHLQVTWIWAWSKHICHKTITVKFSISVLGVYSKKTWAVAQPAGFSSAALLNSYRKMGLHSVEDKAGSVQEEGPLPMGALHVIPTL